MADLSIGDNPVSRLAYLDKLHALQMNVPDWYLKMHGKKKALPPRVCKVDPFAGLTDAERWLIQHESGGNTRAHNPKRGSTAFGLGQMILSTRKHIAAELGFDPNTTDYFQQLAMMRLYIQENYKTAEHAVATWLKNQALTGHGSY
jgi:hypothetical protein